MRARETVDKYASPIVRRIDVTLQTPRLGDFIATVRTTAGMIKTANDELLINRELAERKTEPLRTLLVDRHSYIAINF